MIKSIKPVIYLQGGLGNQLFQYSFYFNCKSLNAAMTIDVGRLVYDKQHENISIISFFNLECSDYLSTKNELLPYLIKDSLLSKAIRYTCRTSNIRNISSSFYDYDAMSDFDSISKTKDKYVGYFQFVESAIFAKSYFENKLSYLYKEKLNAYNTDYGTKVGLHIRRGDFVSSNDTKHECISLDYIKKAIKRTTKSIVVFSDDIEWCQNNLSEFSYLKFHCGESAFDDFLALSQCQNYILSGSTFSWWAAFLFSTSKTEVIYPKGQPAQFLSENSNKKIGWSYIGL